MKPSLLLIAKIFYFFSTLKQISSARSRSSSEGSDATVVLGYTDPENETDVLEASVEDVHVAAFEYEVIGEYDFEAPVYEARAYVVEYDNEDYQPEAPAPPPEIRGSNWCKLVSTTFSGSFYMHDTFYLQSVYYSSDLLKNLQKYQELHPSEDLRKLIEIYFQMDAKIAYASWQLALPLSIDLPNSIKKSDFIKQIASIDENGNLLDIGNMFINARGYGTTFLIQSIANRENDSSKPPPSDIFFELEPRAYANIQFEIFVSGIKYRLQTMADSRDNRIALQASWNQPGYCLFSTAFTHSYDAADPLVKSGTWDLLQYRQVRW